MRRTLSWLVAGTLVAAMGGASMANSQDSFIPIQDPPKVSIGTLYQFFGTADSSRETDRLYPTASSTTARSGFTNDAVAADVSSDGERATFDIDGRASSTDQVRVPDGGGVDTAPIYQQKVTVETNGPIGSIERIGLCILNSSDNAVRDNNAEFTWYDDEETNQSNDVERNCGFSDEDPTHEGSMKSARSGIAIIYDVTDDSFRLNDATTQHDIVLATKRGTQSGDDFYGSYAEFSGSADASGSIDVYFSFRPSHALLKQKDNWIIRAAAQDQAPAVDTDTFDPQVSQIFYGQAVGDHSEGELTDSSSTFRNAWTEISVAYYGALLTDRDDTNYGTLSKGGSSTQNSIDAGRYVANSPSKIWIDATNFENGGDVLSLISGEPQDNQVRLQCSLSDDFGDESVYSQVDVNKVPVELADTLSSTSGASSENSPTGTEDSSPVAPGDGMSCELTYGGGAANASSSYTNTVTLNIADNETSIK